MNFKKKYSTTRILKIILHIEFNNDVKTWMLKNYSTDLNLITMFNNLIKQNSTTRILKTRLLKKLFYTLIKQNFTTRILKTRLLKNYSTDLNLITMLKPEC